MRIAQLANFVGPTSGGMRRAVDQLGEGYVAQGHDRILIIPGPRTRVRDTAAGTIAQVRAPRVTGGYRIIVDLPQVLRLLHQFNPTSIEVSDKWTLTATARWARMRGIGSVLLSHERLDDMASDFTRLPVRTPVRWRNRRLAKAFDRVVVTTRYSAGEWEQTAARLVTVPLGVDLETFVVPQQPAEAMRRLRLVHVGRMSREKYPQLVIETTLELDRRQVPVHLTMVGTGPHLGWLRELAGDGPIRFVGYMDGRAEVAKAYGAAQIAMSVCPTETFGLAVLEALACGTPVVTADRGGARELVDASCAEWGSADPVSLADAVQRLWRRLHDDPATVREAARVRAEQYPWSAAVARMLAVHDEVASEQ